MLNKFLATILLAAIACVTAACGGEQLLSETDVTPEGETLPMEKPGIRNMSERELDELELMLSPADNPPSDTPPVVRLITHDSFAVSDGLIEGFEDFTGLDVQLITGEDTGSVLSQLILTKDNPVADVVFGIDNTFMHQALEEDLFVPYYPAGIDNVGQEHKLDSSGRLTPVDYGDVCVNYHFDALAADGRDPPESLDDLPELADTFVTQNPETSSPGLAFLFATIARFGEGGWEDFWQRLTDGGLLVTQGWSEAYFGEFAAGEGDRALVTSYATSPVAEVLFSDEPVQSPPTGVLTDGCFRQVEFAGILKGAKNLDGAKLLMDFLLTKTFQEDIPLNMFVFPTRRVAEVPEEFLEHAATVQSPLTIAPERIAEHKADWTARWVEIVLR